MSNVDNFILTTPPCQDDTLLLYLNGRLRQYGVNGEFTRVDEFAGGPKCFEVDVYLMATNNSDYAWVAKAVSDTPWVDPEDVQLFHNSQYSFKFAELELR